MLPHMLYQVPGATHDARPLELICGQDIVTRRCAAAQSGDAFSIRAELPGIQKRDIRVEAERGTLTITVEASRAGEGGDSAAAADAKADAESDAERDGAGGEGRDASPRAACQQLYAARSIRLPPAADLDAISAEYADGVLTLRVPKVARAQRRTISIA